jgi:hypothetical protein
LVLERQDLLDALRRRRARRRRGGLNRGGGGATGQPEGSGQREYEGGYRDTTHL